MASKKGGLSIIKDKYLEDILKNSRIELNHILLYLVTNERKGMCDKENTRNKCREVGITMTEVVDGSVQEKRAVTEKYKFMVF